MPKKIQNTTKAHLIGVPLPNHAATYTVISHQFVIDYAYQALAAAGFGIVEEEYRCTSDGQIAQGIYKLNFNNDPELSMMFAWTNSYNKQVKFKCVVGAYINNTGAVMISGEVGSWVRKHTGTADVETKATIDEYVANANMYYNQLVADKGVMESITLNKRKQSQLLGVLFAEYEVLTTEQASSVRDQMKKPFHVFKNSDSLWAFYNYVTNALQFSHPKTWMEDQRILHYFISTIGNFQQVSIPQPVIPVTPAETPVEDPLENNYGEPENQTNLLVQIAEITGDASVLEPQVIESLSEQDEEEGEEPTEDGLPYPETVVEEDSIPADYDFLDTVVASKSLSLVEVSENYGDEVTEEQLEAIHNEGFELTEIETVEEVQEEEEPQMDEELEAVDFHNAVTAEDQEDEEEVLSPESLDDDFDFDLNTDDAESEAEDAADFF
jgi:hypothetical protein